ncbi:MAG: hypothetical protein EOP90_07535 [Lysobacteraceae bacterium]|nr:MAG: hypothetical protein EOP90_07535 [Xanthomonadaceae bacterium]
MQTMERAQDARAGAWCFGGFRLDLAREELVGPGGVRILRRKAFATLRRLLEAAPALVTLDQLLDDVWGRHAISPSAVPNVIVELRQALGDDARAPRFIETRHRRGYRIVVPVTREPATRTASGVTQRGGALLTALEACARQPAAMPHARLRRLHELACENGLPFLAIEVRLALQALCGSDTSLARRLVGS